MNRFFECSQCSEDDEHDIHQDDIVTNCVHRQIVMKGELGSEWLQFTNRRKLAKSYQLRRALLRLRLVQLVYRGFTSSVWLCDMFTELPSICPQTVIMKIIHKAKCSTDEISRLSSEVRLLRKVKHPHIVRLIASVDSATDQLIFLEYAPYGDLYEMTAFKAVEEDTARWIIFQALLALQELHSTHRTIHGDVKAKNFLLFPQAADSMITRSHLLNSGSINVWRHVHIKLSDFGLSQNVPVSSVVPFTGLRGTIGFLAPELLSRQDYSYAIDLWSLGVVTYTLLAGYEPFYPSSVSLTNPIEFDPRYWKNVSSLCKDFISLLLVKDPVGRLTASEALSHPWISTIYSEV